MLVVVLVVCLPACSSKGPRTVSFKGQVVLEKGGDVKELAGYTVEFTASDGTKAYGEIKEDGSFTVVTQHEGVSKEGAVEGPQTVRFLSPNVDDTGKPVKPPINKKYFDSETSNLTCTVSKGAEVILSVSR